MDARASTSGKTEGVFADGMGQEGASKPEDGLAPNYSNQPDTKPTSIRPWSLWIICTSRPKPTYAEVGNRHNQLDNPIDSTPHSIANTPPTRPASRPMSTSKKWSRPCRIRDGVDHIQNGFKRVVKMDEMAMGRMGKGGNARDG